MRLKAHEEQQQFFPRQSGTYHETKLQYFIIVLISVFLFQFESWWFPAILFRVLATPQWQYGFVAANHPSEFSDLSLNVSEVSCAKVHVMYSFKSCVSRMSCNFVDALQFDVVEELASITIKSNPLAEPTRDKVGKNIPKKWSVLTLAQRLQFCWMNCNKSW